MNLTSTPPTHDARGLAHERQARLLTPERVPLTVPVAGIGERAIASLIDALLLLLLVIALLFVYTFWGRGDLEQDVSNATRATFFLLGVAFLVGIVVYDVACDLLFDGRTPGKRLARLRVVDDTGRSPDLLTSLLRNLLRLVDMLPVGYGVGTVVMFFTGTRRLGDLVAGTLVISERARGRDVVDELTAAAAGLVIDAPAWRDDDIARAVDFVTRTTGMAAAPADALCARVLQALPPLPPSTGGPRARLAAAVVAAASAGSGLAARLWRLRDSERLLRRALQSFARGDLGAGEALDSAARAASSELLAATRRGVPARSLDSLSLALLDVERRRRPPPLPLSTRLRRFLAVEVPRAVWLERRGIARAALVLGLAGLVGFSVAWADADLARALVGDELAREIERGATWTDRVERDHAYAGASLQIILNNVNVGLRVFAMGVLGGVATLLGLVSNGLSIGAVFGYATRLGTQDTLARFILAHGPVELSMICVAGAAGLCLGRALLSPGRRTRLRALREEGARGAHLIAFAVTGFVVIGTVEGFVSPGQHFPAIVNAAVGVSLWLLFLGWALSGRAVDVPRPPG